MKTKLTIVTLLVVLVGINAQNQRPQRMSREEVLNKKWEFIVAKAELSQADARTVLPFFNEYENEIWDMMDQNRKLFRRGRRGDEKTQADFEAINEAFINFDIQKAAAQKRYYDKIKRVVSAEVIHRIFNAERTYRQNLIQRIPDRQRNESSKR